MGALRAHSRCSIFKFEGTARVYLKSKSAGGFPGRLLIAIVFLGQLARRLDQLVPIAYASRQLAATHLVSVHTTSKLLALGRHRDPTSLALALANSQPHVSSRHLDC